MDMSQLKTQVMTMFMMKSASAPQGKQSSSSSDIFNILYSMMMLSLVEWMFKHAPEAFVALKTFLLTRYAPKKPAWLPLADKPKKEVDQLNSVTMMRIFREATGAASSAKDVDRADNIYVEKVDAILDYICNIDGAKHIRMDIRCSLNNVEEIELTPLLKAKVKQSNGGEVNVVELVLFSSVLKISDIRNWIDEIHSNYVAEKNNKLGNKIFYFNEVPQEPIIQMDMSAQPPKKSYRWENMPKMLSFNMSEFKTSKSFNNVYGDHVNELKERLDLFVNHPDWYMERGIPHSLGIMLHGVPGAGKTSTIKAIAKDTNRHIFNLSLRPYTTQRQLTNLFFNETVTVHTYDGGKQSLKIPLNRRVYVIEDIDCLTDVVLDRALKSQSTDQAADGDAVTLSFLLNLLDGVLETPGRILVITSNYPEKLDKALVRPGRIDVKIDFKNATRTFILDMINKFYKITMTLDEIPTALDNIFTPAEVMESLCYYFKSPSQAVIHLVQKAETKKLLEVQRQKPALIVMEETAPSVVEEEAPAIEETPVLQETLNKENLEDDIPSYPFLSQTELMELRAVKADIRPKGAKIRDEHYEKLYPGKPPFPDMETRKKKDINLRLELDAVRIAKDEVNGFNSLPKDYLLTDDSNKKYDRIFETSKTEIDESLEGGFASAMFGDAVPPPGAGGNTNFEWEARRTNPRMINLNEV
jgi:hypothetical protein